MSGPTRYGFDWGPMKVERLCHIAGRGYVLAIRVGQEEKLQVYVSEKGQSVRAFRCGEGELTLNASDPRSEERGPDG